MYTHTHTEYFQPQFWEIGSYLLLEKPVFSVAVPLIVNWIGLLTIFNRLCRGTWKPDAPQGLHGVGEVGKVWDLPIKVGWQDGLGCQGWLQKPNQLHTPQGDRSEIHRAGHERAFKVGWKFSGRSRHLSPQAKFLFPWGNLNSVLRTLNWLDQAHPDYIDDNVLSFRSRDCRYLSHLQRTFTETPGTRWITRYCIA